MFARALDLDQAVAFDIEQQPIGSALIAFSKQARIQVVIAPDAYDQEAASGLNARVSARVALDTLLKDTGLKYAAVGASISVMRIGDHSTNEAEFAVDSEANPRHSTGRYTTDSDNSEGPIPDRNGDLGDRSGIGKKSGTDQQNTGNLQEVVVTAQKRIEKLQDVPLSIQVLSADKLADQGVTQLADYAKQVPGLTLIGAAGAGQGQVALRGITSGDGSHPLVGIYLDEVPFTPSSPNSDTQALAFDPDLVDVERIEVLEGPQSTLYGASSMGGVLKFVTKQPNLNDLEGSARTEGSQVDGGGAGYSVRGSANIPVVPDMIGVRASAFYRNDPGFVDNDFNGVKNINHDSVKGARLSVKMKITDDLETTLSGLLQNIDGLGSNIVYLNPVTLRPSLGSLAFSSPIAQPVTIHNRSVSDTTTMDLHFATITNIASFADSTGDTVGDSSFFAGLLGAPGNVGVRSGLVAQSRRWSDEFRLTSVPGKLEWLLGGFYTNERDPDKFSFRGTDSTGNILPSTDPFFNVYSYNNISYFREKAVFGDLTYHLNDRVEGTVGIRYSSNDQSAHWMSTGILGVNDFSIASSDSAETYLATISYKPTSEMTLYVRSASAYRPGGPNIVNAVEVAAKAPVTFGPDKLWNYEGGLKGSLWSQRINYSADIYHMDWSNIQLDVSTNAGLFVTNASSAKSNGAEAAVQIVPHDRLSVSLKVAYTDAKLTAPVAAPVNAASGDRLPYSPKLNAAALVDYRVAALGAVVPTVGFTYAYRGSVASSFTNGASFTLPSYDTLDLRVGLDWSRYTLIARVDNVTNKYGLTDVGATSAAGTPIAGIVIKPRTFGLSFAAKF